MDATLRSQSIGRPRLMDQARSVLREKGFAAGAGQAYLHWIRRFVLFHGKRHPHSLGRADVAAFLDSLPEGREQARDALHFLYRQVLEQPLGLEALEQGRAVAELEHLLPHLRGSVWMLAALLVASSLSLDEAVQLRVRDVDFLRRKLVVRDEQGQWLREVELPKRLMAALQTHLDQVRALHADDLAQGLGYTRLPAAQARRHRRAEREWGWQFVFPARSLDRSSDDGRPRRCHLDPERMQQLFKRVRTKLE